MYGVSEKLLSGVKAIHHNVTVCVTVQVRESFTPHGGVEDGCVMLPWLAYV